MSSPARPSAATFRARRIRVGIIVLVLAVGLGIIGAALANQWRNPGAPGASEAVTTPGSTITTQAEASATPSPTLTPSPSPTPTPEPVSFTILAAGDVLPHTTVIKNAQSGSGWDFTQLWSPVDPWVSAADLALCHMEVPIAPAGREPVGYPVFGAPSEIVANLASAGWDGCSTASNHAVDMGWSGLTATLDAMDAAGLGHVGTARTETEAAAPQLYTLERGGQTITVAHLAATYSTNGIPIPSDAPWSVQMIDTDQLIDQATQARAAGADLVLASVHCCEEYVDTPTAKQVEIANELAASGQVDLMIGNHSHVPQAMDMIPGGPGGAGMWVAYSMGNMISNQDENCCRPQTSTGTFMWATVTKVGDEPPRVTGLEWTAVPGDRLGSKRIYAMPDLLDQRIEAPLLTLSMSELQARQQRVVDVIGSVAPERREPPTPSGPAPTVVPRST